MPDPNINFEAELKARFAALPRVIQNAITSADVENHLRALSNQHKLHIDQWEKLENEVMLALMGIQTVEDLPQNIASHVGLEAGTADALAHSISAEIFEPIREELERELAHPEAKPETLSAVETARSEALTVHEDTPATPAPQVQPETPAAQPIAPGTPPSPPTPPLVEVPAPTEYQPGTASINRKSIANDPYREQI